MAFEPHGTAAMGLRGLPGDKVMMALAAVDTDGGFFFRCHFQFASYKSDLGLQARD